MLKIIMANKGVRKANDVKSIETRLTIDQVMDAVRIQEEKLLYSKASEDKIAELKMNQFNRGK